MTPALTEYLRSNKESFGAERVWYYAARGQLGTAFRSRKATAFWLAALLAGATWVVAGFSSDERRPWLVFGFVVIFAAVMMLLVVGLDAGNQRPPVKNWRRSGLVISPVGLAVVQGLEQGEMHWDELRGLRLRTGGRFFSSSAEGPTAGIELVLDGASFVLADVYDRPLPIILERIKHYWR